MDIRAALNAARTAGGSRPSDLLPVYFFVPAVPIVTRVILFLGIGLGYLYLSATGRLQRIQDELAEIPSPPSTDDPEVLSEWAGEVEPVLELVFQPVIVAILGVTLGLTVLVAALVYAGVLAARFAACRARLEGDRGLTAALRGVPEYGLTMLGVRLLELAFYIGLTLVVAAVSAVGFTLSPLLGFVLVALGVLLWLVGAILVRAVFAFVPVVVVVSGVGVLAGVIRSARFLRSNPGKAVPYYAFSVGITVAFSIGASLVTTIGVAPLAGLVGFIIVVPMFDLVKTALYADDAGTIALPEPPERSPRQRVTAGLGRGWGELRGFVRETPGVHAIGAGLVLSGFALGWAAAAPFQGTVTTSIGDRLAGSVPPVAAVEFATNNWTVGITAAFAGVLAGLPSIASLLFNGFFFGVVARLELVPLELLAFVVPHGLVEIPAIIVSGALGIVLGVRAWRTARGRSEVTDLAESLERAFWILIGVGILMAVAGVIEGFVSPFYYRPFL